MEKENRQLWRDTQRQINELAVRMNDLTVRANDLTLKVADTTTQSRGSPKSPVPPTGTWGNASKR